MQLLRRHSTALLCGSVLVIVISAATSSDTIAAYARSMLSGTAITHTGQIAIGIPADHVALTDMLLPGTQISGRGVSSGPSNGPAFTPTTTSTSISASATTTPTPTPSRATTATGTAATATAVTAATATITQSPSQTASQSASSTAVHSPTSTPTPICLPPRLDDPGFEAGRFPNPYWLGQSNIFDTPLCTVAVCGTDGGRSLPRTGDIWAWFGGTTQEWNGSLSQTIYIPRGTAHIGFYLWIGRHSGHSTADYLRVTLDGAELFRVTDASTSYDSGYSQVTLPPVIENSAGTHTLLFEGHTDAGSGTQITDFSVDDVSLSVEGACSPTCSTGFPDVPPSNAFYSYIQCLACRGIISGYPDGTFGPNNSITRGQLSKIVSNSAAFAEGYTTARFQDVAVGSTFHLFIERLASRNIIGGYPCGGEGEPCVAPDNKPYFRPNANVTRGQTSKIVAIARNLPAPPELQQTFEDVPGNSTFWQWIEALASSGAIQGYPCGGVGEPCNPPGNRPYFRPGANVTRGQTSKIIGNSFFPACTAP